MYIRQFILILFVLVLSACSHKHEETTENDHHEVEKIQYTEYSDDFELFAEADPFIKGDTANLLAHFSVLPDFRALQAGKITMILTVNGKEVKTSLDKPTRTGIYNFNIVPAISGKGSLKFEIVTEKGRFNVDVPEVFVYASEEEHKTSAAGHEKHGAPSASASVFTKEQSWKVVFETNLPGWDQFGQVIKTTALVNPAPGYEAVVASKVNGIVKYGSNNLLEGQEISSGQYLFSISGKGMADNDFPVRFSEARNNYDKAAADYERIKDLAKDKIVSEKELLASKNQLDNSKAIFENLKSNFNVSGQVLRSPINGYIKQLFVKNGEFAQAGQPIAAISQNKTLVLSADVAQKYASVIGTVKTANIYSIQNKKTYTLEELNGRILSAGKTTNSDNYMMPVKIQIDNKDNFTSGSFLEIYLKSNNDQKTLTVPNTALLEDQGVFFVYVQITPEKFEKREVKTGITDGLRTEILTGLSKDERIVTKGAIFIKLAQATATLDAHSGHVH